MVIIITIIFTITNFRCFEDYAVGVVCHDEPQPTALELRGGDER